jgi:hypothetical protein
VEVKRNNKPSPSLCALFRASENLAGCVSASSRALAGQILGYISLYHMNSKSIYTIRVQAFLVSDLNSSFVAYHEPIQANTFRTVD